MNRRDFIKNSVVAGASGLGTEGLFPDQRQPHPDHRTVSASASDSAGKRLVYAHFLDPREHPDYARRHVKPPTWETFDERVHFAALREFDIRDGQLAHYSEKIEKYTQEYQLGDVLWIRYPALFARNLKDLIDEIRQRNLFLFDIWGYVPGSGPGGPWQQFQVPPGVFELLESTLGDRWLGMDNGEQDGRYIAGYAAEFYPPSQARPQQYLNFQRHFERLTNQLGNKLACLVSCNFGHYFLKQGLYTLIGAETAQGLPNAQLFYSFLRGAGKQYGVMWFGNASVYNRWGWKHYGPAIDDSGPTKGTSLSLMKRLMYSQFLYNSVLAGFESGFFSCPDVSDSAGACPEDELSPIGVMQQAAARWLQTFGKPGPMLTPFALMLDFFAGWVIPRRDPSPWPAYRVWGNLPYGPGDYLTDGVLDLLYPGYQNSSFFRDESGFLTATPYGDAADCLLSDAPGWLLARYSVLVVAGELEGGAEVRDKLESYAMNGGHLLITAGNLLRLPNGLAGIQTKAEPTHFPAGTCVRFSHVSLREDHAFDLWPLSFPPTCHVLADLSGTPAALELPFGKGRITVLASPFAIAARSSEAAHDGLTKSMRNDVEVPLAKPYPLLKASRLVIDNALRRQMVFDTGVDLSLITCRHNPGEYLLGISNPSWQQRPLRIVSHCGPITSIRELPLDRSEKKATGYVPEGMEHADLGISDDNNIAAGDMRIFAVQVREENVEEIAHVIPPPRPQRRALSLLSGRSIKEEVLVRPSFFQHFDSVVVNWRYLHSREAAQLERERGWIDLQQLGLFVDLTCGTNLFPDLRLIDNIRPDYLASLDVISDVIAKMKILPAKDLIISLHRYPENNFSDQQTWQSFEQTVRQVCMQADAQGIKVHLRLRWGAPPADLETALAFLNRVSAPNLSLAPGTAALIATNVDPAQATQLLRGRVSLWFMSATETDITGSIWNENAPVRSCRDPERLAALLSIAPAAPIVLDALYPNHDEEYLDVMYLRKLLA